jgi:hypothetical protein
VGVVVVLLVADALLAWVLALSRRRVKRDSLLDSDGLRIWYELQYGPHGRDLSAEDVEAALAREMRARRWYPLIAAAGTLVLVVTLMVSLGVLLATRLGPIALATWRLVYILAAGMRLPLLLMCALIVVTLAEEVMIIRSVADYDICRIRRLLDSLG